MTTYYICRHGETENNENKRLSGWIDTPLTDLGLNNAYSIAAKLNKVNFDRILSSDLGRAFVTAYLISRKITFVKDIERCKQLREVNYGDLANLPIAEAIRTYPAGLNVSTNVAPNGESLSQMQERVLNFLKKVSTDSPNKTILIVGHDGTINAVYANYAKRDIGEVDTVSTNSHDFLAKFTINNGKIGTYILL